MTPDCMTPDELVLWRQFERTRPCAACPMEFHLAEKAAGRCNGEPGEMGRPRLSSDEAKLLGRAHGGKGNGYATPEERLAARRQTWREGSKRRRAA